MSAVSTTAQPANTVDSSPHSLESLVHKELMSDADLQISSLVIRRIADGVCLQGVMEYNDDPAAVTRAALRIAGVGRVKNNLVSRCRQK